MPPRLMLFDGVPGSGKTTLSRHVAALIERSGQPCGWALEEAKDHPFFGSEIKSRHRQRGFAELCMGQWQMVADDLVHRSWALDGCALQSTVRFMFEQDWDRSTIDDYWMRFGDLLEPLDATVIYFRHRDVEHFFRTHTVNVRSDVWDKISRHVINTRVGERYRREGRPDIAIEFWVRYGELSDMLVDQLKVPVLNLDIGAGWEQPTAEALGWLGVPLAQT